MTPTKQPARKANTFALWLLVSASLFIFNLPALIAANEETQEGTK